MDYSIFRAIPTLSLLETRNGPSSLVAQLPLTELAGTVSGLMAAPISKSISHTDPGIVSLSQLSDQRVSDPIIVIAVPPPPQSGNTISQLSKPLPKASPLNSCESEINSVVAGVSLENAWESPGTLKSGSSYTKATASATARVPAPVQNFLPPQAQPPVRVPVG